MPNRRLIEYLEEEKHNMNWYRFTEKRYRGIPEYLFSYIRSLSQTPFDPIAQSDFVDPDVLLEAFEVAGRLFGAETSVKLGVEPGPTPSPIIYQLGFGDLTDVSSNPPTSLDPPCVDVVKAIPKRILLSSARIMGVNDVYYDTLKVTRIQISKRAVFVWWIG